VRWTKNPKDTIIPAWPMIVSFTLSETGHRPVRSPVVKISHQKSTSKDGKIKNDNALGTTLRTSHAQHGQFRDS
jgi:hypothetical protein